MKRRLWIFWAALAVLALYTGLQGRILFPRASAPALWGGTAALFALLVGWQFGYRRRPDWLDSPWFSGLVWAGSIALGVWAGFVLLSLPWDAAGAAGWMSLRALQAGLAAMVAAAALLSVLGLAQAAAGPSVREVAVSVPGLPRDLEGLKIAQISDLHVGPMIGEGYARRVARKTMDAEPDLIAVTGDLADGTTERLRRQVAPLGDLKAPLGAYFVTGNHEYYWGAQAWVKRVEELGLVPLLNENRTVHRGGAAILVGGVTDVHAGFFAPSQRPDVRRAAAAPGRADLRILLAHRPQACREAEPAGFDLQLSGHTHGGQFFPFNLVVRLFQPYLRGLYRRGRMWLHVSPGTGFWGPPHRFWVPAEITLLRLSASSRQAASARPGRGRRAGG